MDYIKAMDKEDLNIMSEFLVMAATLLDIKCRMLLPKEVNEEEKKRSQAGTGGAGLLEQDVQVCPMNCGIEAGGGRAGDV